MLARRTLLRVPCLRLSVTTKLTKKSRTKFHEPQIGTIVPKGHYKPKEKADRQVIPLESKLPAVVHHKNYTSALELRGLPFSITEKEISLFTGGRVKIKDCHIHYSSAGLPSGVAFIGFYNDSDHEFVLGKNGEFIGERYLEICEAAADVLNELVSSGAFIKTQHVEGQHVKDMICIRMRGLPFKAQAGDVALFLKNCRIARRGIVFCKSHDGRRRGEVVVQLLDQKSKQLALGYNNRGMGDRYIEVWDIDGMEFAQAAKGARTNSSNQVLMTGLGFKTTSEDIEDFFAPLPIRHVILSKGYKGRFNGTANVFFDSRKSATIAMQRNNDYLGDRYVTLKQVEIEKMMNLDRFNKSNEERDDFEERLQKHMSGTSNRKFRREQRQRWRDDEVQESLGYSRQDGFDQQRRNRPNFDRRDSYRDYQEGYRQPRRYNNENERNFDRYSRSRDRQNYTGQPPPRSGKNRESYDYKDFEIL